MQLEVKFQEIMPVESNFENLKVELKEQLEKYQDLVVVEDDLPKYKQDRANLNKLKKALNDEKIRVKTEFTAPITAFEAQVKELIGMIDEPINCLDDQLKKYEEKRKTEKKVLIESKFNELNDIDQIKFAMVFQEQWLNVSVSMKKITESIQQYIDKIHAEIQSITDLKSDYEEELHELYLKTFDLTKVLARKNEIDRIIAQREAKRKAEEERKAKEKEEAERKEKERIEREKQEAQEAKERAAQEEIDRLKAELENKESAKVSINPDPQILNEPEKTPMQKLAESQNPELYAMNNLEPQQIDFRVWVTPEQKIMIRDFLVSNNIKFGKVQ